MPPPHFLIIGAQKGGTTALFECLTRSPAVAAPSQKEIHFFDYQYHKGAGWYRGQFPGLTGGLITGEASPYYLFHPHAPGRVRAWGADVKLVALLRNPVDRAYSQYHHEVRLGAETLGFEAAVDAEAGRLRGEAERMLADESYYSPAHQHFSYLARGIYVRQLEAWAPKRFPRKQILVVNSEDLFRSPAAALRTVAAFLGVPPPPPATFRKINDGAYPPMCRATRRRLNDYFRPHNNRLYEYLGRDFAWGE